VWWGAGLQVAAEVQDRLTVAVQATIEPLTSDDWEVLVRPWLTAVVGGGGRTWRSCILVYTLSHPRQGQYVCVCVRARARGMKRLQTG
jgi:hypothetical protein